MKNLTNKLGPKTGWGALAASAGLALSTPAEPPQTPEPTPIENRMVEEIERPLADGTVVTIRKFEADVRVEKAVQDLETAVGDGGDAVSRIIERVEENPIHALLTLAALLILRYSRPEPPTKGKPDEE